MADFTGVSRSAVKAPSSWSRLGTMTGISLRLFAIIVMCAGLGLAGGVNASDPAAETAAVIAAEARAHEHMRSEPPDWHAARAEFEVAARAGSSRAMSYLGWMYETGHGVPVDKPEAARWYGRAAAAGAHEFAIKLGWMHLSGDGVPRDRAASERWFMQAIDAGHHPARIALASVLIADALGGKATERVGEARALLESALDGGERLAAFFLARLFIEGIGGHPVDDVLAARYTRIGAEDGHPQMQSWLATMYIRGAGVAQDRMEAAFWAALAASGGDPAAQDLHAAFASEMSAEQRRAVMERTVEWMSQNRPNG